MFGWHGGARNHWRGVCIGVENHLRIWSRHRARTNQRWCEEHRRNDRGTHGDKGVGLGWVYKLEARLAVL